MSTFKQEMPPPGGFSPVTFQRIPLKKSWPLSVRFLFTFAIMGVGWYGYYLDKKRIIYEAIEKRAATFSIMPLMVAENDRIKLKHYRLLRDTEADLMKDVKGWKVGTHFGEPIYKTLKPNQWYDPHALEMWNLTDYKDFDFSHNVRVAH